MELLSNSDKVSHKCGSEFAPKQTGDLVEARKGQHVSGTVQPAGIDYFEDDRANPRVEGKSQPNSHHCRRNSKVRSGPHGSDTRIEQTGDPSQAESGGENQSRV